MNDLTSRPIAPTTNNSGENSRCESDEEYSKQTSTVIPIVIDTDMKCLPQPSLLKSDNPPTNGRSSDSNIFPAANYSNASTDIVNQSSNSGGNGGDGGNTSGFHETSNSSSNGCEGLSPMATFNEERMRRKLQFFFMNPIEKWQARKKFPYKFVVQVAKIILVTIQLCLFAHSRYNHVNYTWDNRVAFSHLFLKGWDASQEVESYPPSIGPLAIYQKSEFFDTIDYAIKGYKNMEVSIGPYDYPTMDNKMAPLKLCFYSFRQGIIFGFNESYIFDPEIDMRCENLTGNVTAIGVEEYLKQRGVIVNFAALVKATLVFGIKTVSFKAHNGPLSAPDCFHFEITILFDNSDHDGQMLLSLDTEAKRLRCRGNVKYITDQEFDTILRSTLNILVIVICVLSFALCARALYRAYLLRVHTVNFFRMQYRKELSFDGRMEFVNFWYIMILFNDVLLIAGSALKEQIERKFLVLDSWDTCSMFLGIGNLLVWFGVLRYLGFFKTYNVVILTLKKAAPKIARFLICALLIYAGFTFCGWLILGPYHMKFRSLATTSECLFSLINGDDMFATFATLSSKSLLLWSFCQIYLYSFISVYIYVVLSLFISVIMDAYDTIKRYYRDGFPLSDLHEFIGKRTDEDITSGVFLNDFDDFENNSLMDNLMKACCCATESPQSSGQSGYTSLTSIIK